MPKNSRKIVIALYIGIALYLLPMFPHGGSANELTRWATAASLIEKGSFEISWTEPLIGPNVDTARIGDRVYSNKAPGPALAAAPIYALTRLFTGPPDASNIRISWFAMRWVTATLPLLLLAIWLYRRGTDEFGLAALLFATPLFVYSLLFFSHVLAAVLVYAAFRLIFDEGEFRPLRFIAAGAAAGMAVISEFPAVFAVAVFGVGMLFAERHVRTAGVGYFVVGGLPFAAFLLIYNNAVFGSPFSLSYAHESFPEWAAVANTGVFGIGVPTLSNIYLLLVSPSRGLLFFSPILILTAANFFTSTERATLRHRVKAAAVLISILVLCGHGAAHGGWAFGPRYLVFVLPLMLDSVFNGEMKQANSVVKGAFFEISLLLCTLAIFTFPFAPPEFQFPHNDLWVAFIRQEGWFVPNAANVLGAASSGWTVIPAVIALAVVMLLVARNSLGPARFLAGTAAAIVIFGAYVMSPTLGGTEAAFRRASIAERYFRPAGRLDKFGSDPVYAARTNDFRWIVADARSYAPDDFPYLETRLTEPSPTVLMKAAGVAQESGNIGEAERLLLLGAEKFAFARCEFTTNLAVVYFMTGRKDAALAGLESVQPLVTAASRPICLRSQYLLGSLYKELGRETDSNTTFQRFLSNSAQSEDAEIRSLRKQLNAK